MIFLHMHSPRPVPLGLVVNNGSKILSRFCLGIPGPSSKNSMLTKLESSLTDMMIFLDLTEMALLIMFENTA